MSVKPVLQNLSWRIRFFCQIDNFAIFLIFCHFCNILVYITALLLKRFHKHKKYCHQKRYGFAVMFLLKMRRNIFFLHFIQFIRVTVHFDIFICILKSYFKFFLKYTSKGIREMNVWPFLKNLSWRKWTLLP